MNALARLQNIFSSEYLAIGSIDSKFVVAEISKMKSVIWK